MGFKVGQLTSTDTLSGGGSLFTSIEVRFFWPNDCFKLENIFAEYFGFQELHKRVCESALNLVVKKGSRSSGKAGGPSEVELSGKSFGGTRI